METNETHIDKTETSSKKMGKLRASYLLAIEGLELLKKDKEVLLFPVYSGFASLVLLIIFIILYALFGGDFAIIGIEDTAHELGAAGYASFLLLYLGLAFISTFFQAGLTAMIDARINGKSMTFQKGVNTAKAHVEKIFLWSLTAATVWVVLGMISDRSRWLGKLVSGLLAAAWGIITFFIVPVLILEEGNVSEAIKISASTFKKTWGETIVVNFGAGFFFGLVAFSGVLFSALLMILCFVFLPSVVAIPIFFLLLTLLVIFLIGACVFSSAINSIFRVVLYEYAKSGHIADTFAPELILGALKKKE